MFQAKDVLPQSLCIYPLNLYENKISNIRAVALADYVANWGDNNTGKDSVLSQVRA
jgi:hypothetical protein